MGGELTALSGASLDSSDWAAAGRATTANSTIVIEIRALHPPNVPRVVDGCECMMNSSQRRR